MIFTDVPEMPKVHNENQASASDEVDFGPTKTTLGAKEVTFEVFRKLCYYVSGEGN